MTIFLLNSNLWFRNKKGLLLFNEVLNEIKKCELIESKKYLLKHFKNEENNINKLKNIVINNNNNQSIIQQDIINNGLKSKYSKIDLLKFKSINSNFDPINFYNNNLYLNERKNNNNINSYE